MHTQVAAVADQKHDHRRRFSILAESEIDDAKREVRAAKARYDRAVNHLRSLVRIASGDVAGPVMNTHAGQIEGHACEEPAAIVPLLREDWVRVRMLEAVVISSVLFEEGSLIVCKLDSDGDAVPFDTAGKLLDSHFEPEEYEVVETATFNPMNMFVDQECTIHPDARVKVCDIYEAWKSWCSEMGLENSCGSKAGFVQKLCAAVPSIRRYRPPHSADDRRREYLGIELTNALVDFDAGKNPSETRSKPA